MCFLCLYHLGGGTIGICNGAFLHDGHKVIAVFPPYTVHYVIPAKAQYSTNECSPEGSLRL